MRDILSFNISGQKKLIFLSLNGHTGCIKEKIAGILRRKLPGYLLKGFVIAAKFIDPQKYLIGSNVELYTYSAIGSFCIKVEISCF